MIAVFVLTASSATAASIEKLFSKPVCFIETKDSDLLDQNDNPLIDVVIIELVYLKHTQTVVGVFNILPAERDQTYGIFDGFTFEQVEGDSEKYLIKSAYHWTSEGDNHISEYNFIVSNDEIKIGRGERNEGELPNTYFYKNPENIDYSYTLVRAEC